jgi:hypothetical protein
MSASEMTILGTPDTAYRMYSATITGMNTTGSVRTPKEGRVMFAVGPCPFTACVARCAGRLVVIAVLSTVNSIAKLVIFIGVFHYKETCF